jgi:hypothetical protein
MLNISPKLEGPFLGDARCRLSQEAGVSEGSSKYRSALLWTTRRTGLSLEGHASHIAGRTDGRRGVKCRERTGYMLGRPESNQLHVAMPSVWYAEPPSQRGLEGSGR